MRDLFNHLIDLYANIRNWYPHRKWVRSAGILTVVLMLVVGINALNGFQDKTQAAADPDLAGNLSSDVPDPPNDFQFAGRGRITAGMENKWIIGGVPIQVDDHTQLMGKLHVGDFVNLSGRISGDQVWIADRIELAESGDSFFTFNGPLEWMRGSIWRIGGHSLLVNLLTDLGSDFSIDNILLATFNVLENGAWQALEIKAFDPAVFEPTATPTLTLTPTERPLKSAPTATTMAPSADHNEEWDQDDDRDFENDDDDDDDDDDGDDDDEGDDDDDDDDD